MKPVRQNVLYSPEGIGNGNCFAAALASLLEIPLWMVPPFEQMFGRDNWRARVDEWLERIYGLRMVRLQGHQVDRLPEFYIANGLSPRGVHHSTIYRAGELVHDPHPSDGGIGEVSWTWHFEPIK